MRKLAALAILAIVLMFPAFSGDPDSYSVAQIRMDVSGSAAASGIFENILFETTFFPKDDARQVASCDRAASGGVMSFGFSGSEPVSVRYSCTVTTKAAGPAITGKEPFPLAETPGFASYLSESSRVKLTPETVLLARRLTKGSGTEFEALVRIGRFVNSNISYNYSYYGLRLPSDQVLAVRQGVCEEFAHLFIALARAAGIPARYAGGYAWGGRGVEGFAPHGWAEAYFPGAGWVPFDPTSGFAQWGYLDAGHVKLFDSADAEKTVEQVSYDFYGAKPSIEWTGVNPTEPEFTLLSGSGSPGSTRITSLRAVPAATAPSSGYVMLVAGVDNWLPVPAAPEISLIYKASNFEESENMQLVAQTEPVIIPAGGEGSVRFVLRTPAADRGSYYLFPVRIGEGGRLASPSLEMKVMDYGSNSRAEIAGSSVRIYAPRGKYSLVAVDSGSEMNFTVGAEGFADIPMAGFAGPVFSTSGAFLELPAASEGPVVVVPQYAYSDEKSVNATVYSESPITVSAGGSSYEIPAGGAMIPVEIGPDSKVRITVVGSGESFERTVARIERPSVVIRLPPEIPPSGTMAESVVSVRNGNVTSSRLRSGEYSGFDSIFLRGERCGSVSVEYSVGYADAAGRPGLAEGVYPVSVSCGGILDRLLAFLAGLLGSCCKG